MQQVVIAGRLGKDPVRKSVGSASVAEFSVAVDQYNGKGADRTTNWYTVTVFGGRSEWLAENLAKGAHVTVVGRLSISPKRDGDGVWLNIDASDVSLSPRAAGDVSRERPASSRSQAEEVGDDDIPF